MTRFRPFLLLWFPPALALAVVVMSCGGGGGAGGEPPSLDGGDAPFGLEARVALSPLAFPDAAPPPTEVGLTPVFSSLSFTRPVLLTAAPDASPWLYVVEQGGRILVFEADDDVQNATTFLDLGGVVSRASNEEGLLGLAFDPNYGNGSGTFWVYYSAASPRRSVVARHEATFPAVGPPIATASSGSLVLEIPQPAGNHNGGMIAFGSDQMLYVGLGDGGGGNDQFHNGQDRGTLLGTILRLDVRAQTTYAVPSDNPFVGVAGVRGEIWAWGLRNPWRFSFDRATADLWVGDVGQGAREEVGLVRAGENHGWPVYEGTRSHLNPTDLPPEAFAAPVADYPRTEGTCVVGGFVYRGQDVPSLRGAYLYGDYGSGRIWALVRHESGAVISNAEVASLGQLSSFGEDHRGELYAVSLGGAIRRFTETAVAPPAEVPVTLSATGLFLDTATLEPNPGLIEFDVASPLHSDGTTKRRWLALPNESRIGFAETGAWVFPRGTVLVKHFELPLRVGDPSSARRLETRALVHESDGWRGYAYRWRDAQDDADLLPGAYSEVFTVVDAEAPGGTREQRYDYPSPTDCLRCHTTAAGFVLGPRTLQMNRDFTYPAAQDNQLRAWNHIGLFDRDIGAATRYGAQPEPSDEASPLAARARSYLDANCAFCHQPGGPAPGDLDLRFGTSVADMQALGVVPSEGDLGLPYAARIRPGAKESSVLWERMRLRGDHQMPPLATHLPDPPAIQLVGEWIDAMPSE